VTPRLLVIVTLAEAGGAQTFAATLVAGLRDRYEIELATHGPDGALADACAALGVPFHRQATMVGFALATVSVLVALWVLPGNVPHGTGVSNGRGVGYWLSLIVIAIGLVLAFIRMRNNGAGRQNPSGVGGNPGRGASSGSMPAAAGPPPGPPLTPPGGPPPAGPPGRPPGASPNPPPR